MKDGQASHPPTAKSSKEKDGAGSGSYLKKKMILAATYPEIQQVDKACPADHSQVPIRGQSKTPDGTRVPRGQASGVYPLLLGLEWSKAIAEAVLRLAGASAQYWASRELTRIIRAEKTISEERENVRAVSDFAIMDIATGLATSEDGESVAVFQELPRRKEASATGEEGGERVPDRAWAVSAPRSGGTALPQVKTEATEEQRDEPVVADEAQAKKVGMPLWGSAEKVDSSGSTNQSGMKWRPS